MSVVDMVPMWFRYRVMDLRGRGLYSDFADECKCIFIHIPKTAGTSVALALFGKGSRHVPLFEYERANGWKFKRYFKFAFVRNPWDRLVSSYFFLKRGGLNEMDKRWADENLSGFDDFDSFVRGWITEDNIGTWLHFLPQHHFICDDMLNIKVDFVGRVESMEADFAYVAKRLGCMRPITTANKGTHRHYSEYYSPETRDIVGQVYRNDIRLFGYRFEVDRDEAQGRGVQRSDF
jgi:chondroitin 4-sulfotransferase 11